MCVIQSRLEIRHWGLSPISKTGDYSDIVLVVAEGRRPPWPEVSRFDQDEMRDLIRETVNKIYTFVVKVEDPRFFAWRDFARPQNYEWNRPMLDWALMHSVKEYARIRWRKGWRRGWMSRWSRRGQSAGLPAHAGDGNL